VHTAAQTATLLIPSLSVCQDLSLTIDEQTRLLVLDYLRDAHTYTYTDSIAQHLLSLTSDRETLIRSYPTGVSDSDAAAEIRLDGLVEACRQMDNTVDRMSNHQ